MNYQETLEYLYLRLPMFTRVGASAYRTDLTNTLELCASLGNPQHKFKSIHVTGTNGKGSTSHMLAAILQIAGYKTGLYTSPHLLDFRERIRLNGQMITQESVVEFVKEIAPVIEKLDPSFFEVTVAMAFDYFVKSNVDIAVIEVGLGGRLDSTNVINPLLSVITNISFDHMNLLGNTLKAIAGEKAGIIKPNTPVIIGENQEEVSEVFLKKALEVNADLTFASDVWNIERTENDVLPNENLELKVQSSADESTVFDLSLDLTGSYQIKNLGTVLSAVDQLKTLGFKITHDHVRTALAQVKTLTGLMGRWQTLSTNPLIICDTGHNEHGIREVLKNIEATPHKLLHIVIGMVNDKDSEKILQLLPKSATYYFCQPNIERAKAANILAENGRNLGLQGDDYPTVSDAVQAAKSKASANDLIFIGGSTFVVAEVV